MAAYVTDSGGGQIDVVFRPLSGDLARQDRQAAWEVYVQLLTRVPLRGRVDGRGEDHFRGEVLAESFDDLDAFLDAGRGLVARYPGGLVELGAPNLGTFLLQTMELVVRPFVLEWQAEFRYWWEENRIHGAPQVIQTNFPRLEEMLEHWICVRRFVRQALAELRTAYGFADVSAPPT